MAKISFILGLCASGKSYLANKMGESSNVLIIDEGFNPDVDPPFYENYKKVLDSLKKGVNCVVIEIALCIRSYQIVIVNKLKNDIKDIEIEWICIENDLEQANKNITYRLSKGEKGSQGHVRINEEISPMYTYPQNAKILPMFRPKN